MITGEQARVKSTEALLKQKTKVFEDIENLVKRAIENGQFEVNYTVTAMQESQYGAIINYLTNLGYKVIYKNISRDRRSMYVGIYDVNLSISW